ncbi:uncharacterized protein si:dkey-87o1.2 [Notolabrus celidotus]|uniref:uncharacterized protein si:dkey-87o1.2 n=1 Tax=Notolabrus celidotus TaxID=1203425 RepID=UPI00148F472B|nr:uncharacterized protein si:dkey-87o1.2 [Notolabrus celidotus]
MKIAGVLAIVSLVVMVVIIFQAVHQELQMRNAKLRVVENSEEVKRKEEAILEVKTKLKTLKQSMKDVNGKMEELKKKKEDLILATNNFGQSLQTCNNEKTDIVKKKIDLTKVVSELKAGHEDSKKKAEVEIQSLKQQILDRDKAICAFADTTKEEARKLCGISASVK